MPNMHLKCDLEQHVRTNNILNNSVINRYICIQLTTSSYGSPILKKNVNIINEEDEVLG